MERKKLGLEEESFNITPLIDCVFLLLIFFMVTTVFKNPAQLKTSLPEAENPVIQDKRQLICEVDADGNIALNGKIIPKESFDTYLVSEKQSTGNKSLLLKADLAVKHGEILYLMKTAREVQIETIVIAVEDASIEQ